MEDADCPNFSEATSDSDCELQDLDEDEDFFASADIPKLQLRKVISKARWIDNLGMAEVLERKGKLWTTTGIVRNGKIYCLVEETLYLAEIGALHLLDGDDQPLSLKDIYSNVLHNKNGCCWEAFEVYKHLKSLGYIIGRHGKPWTMKSAKANSTSLQAVSNFDEQVDGELEVNNSLTELFSGIQIKQVRPLYNVYLPDGKFKKSSPDHPSFVLCLTRNMR
ncbi:hypothetical protein M9H77_04063 [Catharanthus roseus]|uniref:Uncharacterized protein n=1 Tax=Catharanthus roseus TaxID=4058 RepID=A0ACC0CD30_CATRO|nr:hypothetical protein M9H77_04063 [Catharanthus roseus]